jgi:hypothetical protein
MPTHPIIQGKNTVSSQMQKTTLDVYVNEHLSLPLVDTNLNLYYEQLS